MRLVDTHCHLDLYPDYAAVIAAVEQKEIYTIAVTNTPSVFRPCVRLTQNTRFIRTAVGLHPELAMQRFQELPLLIELLPQTRYVGEVGLDFVTRDESNRARQKQVFRKILDECASVGNKILTIHSRRAANEVVEMIGNSYPGTIILHWYSGPITVLRKAVSYGYYFSVNPAMITSAKGRAVISEIPKDQLLTETDGPFVQIDGRSCRPYDVERVIEYLATLWSTSRRNVCDTIYLNFRHLLTIR